MAVPDGGFKRVIDEMSFWIVEAMSLLKLPEPLVWLCSHKHDVASVRSVS